MKKTALLVVLTLVVNLVPLAAPAQDKKPPVPPAPVSKGRAPVIIVPGLIGSELVNRQTGAVVWFDLGRSKEDDLRLPISPDLKANRDNLEPRDILREIQLIKFTPKIEIYQKLIDTLRGDGFTEGKIDAPAEGGDQDTFYVFAYDWRLDNVENARILLDKLDSLRAKLKRPALKFNVVAHSMGGLISRYAAMYGKSDIPAGRTPRPTWKGASYFNSIALVATPNAGATSALDSLINGFSLFGSGKINLPFVQNLGRADLFTIQSVYQLLPHPGTARVFDENLRPMRLDLYSVATWEKYGWAAYGDDDFDKRFDEKERGQARAYFRAVLARAKAFQTAIDALPTMKSPVPTFYLGAECRETIDGVIVRREKDKWKTEFGPVAFTNSAGRKVTKEETEKVMLSPGDGVVPSRSLLSSFTKLGRMRNAGTTYMLNAAPDACSEHNRLTGDGAVSKNLISILNGGMIDQSATAGK